MRSRRSIDAPEIQIAPMIDCVFLMLVYFMTTSSLEKSEADLHIPAGGPGMPADPMPTIDEQTLEFRGTASLNWNGTVFDMLLDPDVAALSQRLKAFRAGCLKAGAEPSLRLMPEGDTLHQMVVDLLDAIDESGIEKIHFP